MTSRLEVPWGIGATIGILILSLIVSAGLTVLGLLVGALLALPFRYTLWIAVAMGSIGLALPALVLLLWRRLRLEAIGLIPHRMGRSLMIGLILGLGVGLVGYAFQHLWGSIFPPPQSMLESYRALTARSPLELAALLLINLVFVAVSEEILARGFLQRGLEARLGRMPGLMLASIIFGLMHLEPWLIPGTIVLGLIIGYIFQKANYNLLVPIGAHAGNNWLAMIFLYLNPP